MARDGGPVPELRESGHYPLIYVTVGTHVHPFDRLVSAADALAEAYDEEVLVQSGESKLKAARARFVPYFPHDEHLENLKRCRLVITHAGPASIFEAADAGVPLVVMPRSSRHGEHVDDHQERFGERIRHQVVVVTSPGDLLSSVGSGELSTWKGQADPSRFAECFGALVGNVVKRRRCRRSVGRATLVALSGLVRRR
jgi:UDP-N-acetylglucosamine transferase subunit ALG13